MDSTLQRLRAVCAATVRLLLFLHYGVRPCDGQSEAGTDIVGVV